jgi:hypothetical protein
MARERHAERLAPRDSRPSHSAVNDADTSPSTRVMWGAKRTAGSELALQHRRSR